MPLCRLLAYEVIGVWGGTHHAEERREAGREVFYLTRHRVCVSRLRRDVERRGARRVLRGDVGERWVVDDSLDVRHWPECPGRGSQSSQERVTTSSGTSRPARNLAAAQHPYPIFLARPGAHS